MHTIFNISSFLGIIFFVTACKGEKDFSPTSNINQKPVASFTYQSSVATLSLDGSSSYDPDNDELTFSWTLPERQAEGESTSVTFAEPGQYSIVLAVADAEFQSSATKTFEVDDQLRPRLIDNDLPPAGNQITRGKAQFESEEMACSTCHGLDGESRGFPKIDPLKTAFTHRETGDTEYSLEQYLAMWMPVGAPQSCSEQCAADIAMYIRSWTADTNEPDPIAAPSIEPEPISTPTIPTPLIPAIDLRVVAKSSPGSSAIPGGTAPFIAELFDGVAINLADHRLLDVEALPRNVDAVGAVAFTLSGALSLTHTEGIAGYFLNTDEGFFDRDVGGFPAGSYTLKVEVTDPNNVLVVTRTIHFSIIDDAQANSPPIANASRSMNLSGKAPLTVAFNAAASSDDQGIAQYIWTTGDGSTELNGANAQYTYTRAGQYTANLRVIDGGGLRDTSPFVVNVAAPTEPPTDFNSTTFYSNNCAGCHGVDGQGTAFIGDASVLDGKSKSRDELITIISRMPSVENPACEGIEGCREAMADFLFAHFITEESGIDPLASCQQQNGLLPPKLRRLTRNQFKNTVESVFDVDLSGVEWPDFGDGIPTLGMSNNADTLRINTINFENVYAAVDTLVNRVLSGNTSFASCVNSNNNNCVDSALTTYAPLLWRRPLSGDETSQLRASLATLRAQDATIRQEMEWLLKTLLLSSNFMFRYEMGVAQSDVKSLTDYELASLLSYGIWDYPPDNTLYNLAAEGALRSGDTLEKQVRRMIQDERFAAVLVEFYSDFLKLDRILSVEKIADLNFSPDIRSALLNSARSMLGDGVSDLNSSTVSPLAGGEFYVNDVIAQIFGLDGGIGSGLSKVSLPANERQGLLTHPAFLSVHAKEGASGIVKRGVFTMKQMLCTDFGDPPDDLSEAELPPNIDPATTSTRRLLDLQHSSQPTCNNCHRRLDPAGYGFENYDAIGQFRLFEKGSVPIDSSGQLTVKDGGSQISFSNGVEYTQALLSTPELQACVTRRFAEYMTGQSLANNSCELTKLMDYTERNGSSIEKIIMGVMQLESIRMRQ